MDSPLKWHGGKHYLAAKFWELAKSVQHVHRVEVFGGSLAFTLATDPEGFSEVVNDSNGDLMNFWEVMRDADLFGLFAMIAQNTPFSEAIFHDAASKLSDQRSRQTMTRVDRALAFFIVCRQSMSARMKSFAPLTKRRTRRGMNEQASAWISAVDRLQDVHDRLHRVSVRSTDFGKAIASEDSESTLFYCDPPYVHETRKTTAEYGEYEMTIEDHRRLLLSLSVVRGKFILSGYRNHLYDAVADEHGWRRQEFDLPNNSARAATKERRTECVWTNF